MAWIHFESVGHILRECDVDAWIDNRLKVAGLRFQPIEKCKWD
jgi:hypothetical protein